MHRPRMEPTFVKDLLAPTQKRPPSKIWREIRAVMRWFWRSLMTNPFAIPPAGQEAKAGPFWKVLLRVAVCWAIFLPILLGAIVTLSVFLGTHPSMAAISADPASQGVFFESVHLTSTDGTPLEGWLIPAIDAQRVVDEKDRTLHLSRPAIVLVHNYGQTMQQMLPLVRPLHEEGLVVLILGLRGSDGKSMAAQTFGLKESNDVSAAVDSLRKTAFVDSNRIAVMGVGSGANAALIAAAQNNGIKAIIVANPLSNPQEIGKWVSPRSSFLAWTAPISLRVFEMMCSVDCQELDPGHQATTMKSRPSLVILNPDFLLGDTAAIKQIRLFCRSHLRTREPSQLGSAR